MADKQATVVNLGDKVKGEIELPSMDVTQYVGRKTKINNVVEYQGDYGYFIKVESDVIDEPKDKAGNPLKDKNGAAIQLRATRLFGLQENSSGELGWGAKTKLAVFLAKMKVAHYRDLIGKEVIVQTVTSKEDGKEYLTF